MGGRQSVSEEAGIQLKGDFNAAAPGVAARHYTHNIVGYLHLDSMVTKYIERSLGHFSKAAP